MLGDALVFSFGPLFLALCAVMAEEGVGQHGQGDSTDEAVKQVEWLVREKKVQTICVHGDNPDALAFTTAVRAALLARGFELKYFV